MQLIVFWCLSKFLFVRKIIFLAAIQRSRAADNRSFSGLSAADFLSLCAGEMLSVLRLSLVGQGYCRLVHPGWSALEIWQVCFAQLRCDT